MPRPLLVVIFALTLTVAGCRPKPLPAPVPERVEFASPSDIDTLRAAYKEHYPNSQLGVVVAAIKSDNGNYVAVGGIDVGQMAVNQVVTFIDWRQRVLTTGRVVRVLDNSVHVAVDPSPAGGREPQVGDMMLRL